MFINLAADLAGTFCYALVLSPIYLVAKWILRKVWDQLHPPARVDRPTDYHTATAHSVAEDLAIQKGDDGEFEVAEELDRVLTGICGDDFTLFNSIILRHAPGTKFPTAEVDHLVVTKFGIYVIETKNWSGYVYSGEDGSLMREAPDGTIDVRKNPLDQNASKVRFLKSIMPLYSRQIHSIGVFSNPTVELSSDLDSSLVRLSDLELWFRQRRDLAAATSFGPIDLSETYDTILAHGNITDEARESHYQRVTSEN